MAERHFQTSSTELPSMTVLSDGQEVGGEFAVRSVYIHKSFNKISVARLVLLDGDIPNEDFPASNEDLFIPGKEIEIKLGYHGDEETVFKGIITKHSLRSQRPNSSLLEVEVKDAAIKMTIDRKNKYFAEVTDTDIIEEICNEYGITNEIEATVGDHFEMVQHYVTDWDFIVTRAEANGMLVLPDDGTLIVKKPSFSGSAVLDLVYGQNIIEFETCLDALHQYEAVTSKAWDFTNQELTELDGNDPGFADQGNLPSTELASVIGLQTLDIRHSGRLDQTELQNWADSTLLRSRLAKIQGRIRIIGFNGITPGDLIDLSGLGDRFNGSAYVSAVSHVFGRESIWYTDLHIGFSEKWLIEQYTNVMDRPAGGLLSGVNGLQVGKVTAIHDDPDGEDRVQVRLPVLDLDGDGIWARVSTLDAGENRGSFFRPEVDDEVIIGFINDDPRDAIILGMVHSSAKPSPVVAEESNPIKGFVTRSEMKLLFDDDAVTFTIETPNGNKILISDDEGSINIEDQNGNTIVMDSSGIAYESASDITFKASGNIKIEGTNVELKASASLKAEGSGSSELSSSATTIVKGSLVQIN